MRNRILALAALAAAIGSPLAAQAQSGTVGRAPVVVDSGPTIPVEQRPAFRDYVVEQRVPAFRIPDRVVVGATLPESGVTYYDVPATFWRHHLSLHRRERRDRAGRAALAAHRRGDGLTLSRIN
ncbi:hypothetical protein ACVW0I_002230 [Bradyrhizobium sp. LM6.11]